MRFIYETPAQTETLWIGHTNFVEDIAWSSMFSTVDTFNRLESKLMLGLREMRNRNWANNKLERVKLCRLASTSKVTNVCKRQRQWDNGCCKSSRDTSSLHRLYYVYLYHSLNPPPPHTEHHSIISAVKLPNLFLPWLCPFCLFSAKIAFYICFQSVSKYATVDSLKLRDY